jgi:hypothetical protein
MVFWPNQSLFVRGKKDIESLKKGYSFKEPNELNRSFLSEQEGTYRPKTISHYCPFKVRPKDIKCTLGQEKGTRTNVEVAWKAKYRHCILDF